MAPISKDLGAGTAIALLSFLAPFVTGYGLIWPRMFRNYEVKRQDVQLLFATTFALSINILLLTVYEVADVLDDEIRSVLWRLLLVSLVAFLVVILPWAFFYTAIVDLTAMSTIKARALALAALGLFMYLFWVSGRYLPIAPITRALSLDVLLGRIAVVGVTTAAVLGGYGTVARPYDLYLTYIVAGVRDDEVALRKLELRRGVDRIFGHQRALALALFQLHELRTGATPEATAAAQHQQVAVQGDAGSRVAPMLADAPGHSGTGAGGGGHGLMSPQARAGVGANGSSSSVFTTPAASGAGAQAAVGTPVVPAYDAMAAASGVAPASGGELFRRRRGTGGAGIVAGGGFDEAASGAPPLHVYAGSTATSSRQLEGGASTSGQLAAPPMAGGWGGYSSTSASAGDGGGDTSHLHRLSLRRPGGPSSLLLRTPSILRTTSSMGDSDAGGAAAGVWAAAASTHAAAGGPPLASSGHWPPHAPLASSQPGSLASHALYSSGGFAGGGGTTSIGSGASDVPGFGASLPSGTAASAANGAFANAYSYGNAPFPVGLRGGTPHPQSTTAGGGSGYAAAGPHFWTAAGNSEAAADGVYGGTAGSGSVQWASLAMRKGPSPGASGAAAATGAGTTASGGAGIMASLINGALGRRGRTGSSESGIGVAAAGGPVADAAGGGGGFMSYIGNAFLGAANGFVSRSGGGGDAGGAGIAAAIAAQEQQLLADVSRLEQRIEDEQTNQRELFMEIAEMIDVKRRHTFSRTWYGRLFNLFSLVMSLWGAQSLINAVLVLVFRQDPNTSIVIRVLSDSSSLPSRMLSHVVSVPVEYIPLAVQPVSSVLVFIMAGSSVPGFLQNFVKLFSSLSQGLTSNSVVLLLAEVMGTYFIAQVLQVRMTIPEARRENLMRAIGNIDFNFLHRWQHAIFIVSAAASVVLFMLYAKTRYTRPSGGSGAVSAAAVAAESAHNVSGWDVLPPSAAALHTLPTDSPRDGLGAGSFAHKQQLPTPTLLDEQQHQQRLRRLASGGAGADRLIPGSGPDAGPHLRMTASGTSAHKYAPAFGTPPPPGASRGGDDAELRRSLFAR